jgi:DNA repair photolyase
MEGFKMKSTLYAPEGLAAENCQIALNTMDGCIHGCKYCYVPLVRHIPREKFHASTRPRIRTEDIEAGAKYYTGEKHPVQLCFTTDPYQDDDVCCVLTRAAIEILHRYGFPVSILTKGGARARHDLDLFRPGDSFGVTITCLDEKKSRLWEPGAASPEERMQNVMEAKMAGIDTRWLCLITSIGYSATGRWWAMNSGKTSPYTAGWRPKTPILTCA